MMADGLSPTREMNYELLECDRSSDVRANSVSSEEDPICDKAPFYDSYNPSFEPNAEYRRHIEGLNTEKPSECNECGKLSAIVHILLDVRALIQGENLIV